MTAVEIAVQDAAGAEIAARAGADRLELCAALGVGGLTPSAATIAQTVAVGLPVHVLIRPRAGGYLYTNQELALQVDEVTRAVDQGVAGVVVGVLAPGGALDLEGLNDLITAANGREVTFHRAFDIVAQPLAVLEELIDLGVTRLLTSGQAARAAAGADLLTKLVAQAAGRIQIQAGGGVRIEDIASLVKLGVDAVHLSARTSLSLAGPAGPGGGEASTYDATDPTQVAAAVRAAKLS